MSSHIRTKKGRKMKKISSRGEFFLPGEAIGSAALRFSSVNSQATEISKDQYEKAFQFTSGAVWAIQQFRHRFKQNDDVLQFLDMFEA